MYLCRKVTPIDGELEERGLLRSLDPGKCRFEADKRLICGINIGVGRSKLAAVSASWPLVALSWPLCAVSWPRVSDS